MLIIILIAEKKQAKGQTTHKRSLLGKHSVGVTLIASIQNSETHSPTHLMFPYDTVRKVHTEGKYFRKTQRVCYLDSISTIGHVHGEAPFL